VIRQFRRADATVIKWSLSRVLDWKTVPQVDCPVFHIHGRRDFVLPARYTLPDQLIEQGRHVISLSHPAEVNEFIRGVIAETERLHR
jgi:pimeloyl-ACP methyl ester carboxylesterase